MIKNERSLLSHGTLISAVSQEWMDSWAHFFHANTDFKKQKLILIVCVLIQIQKNSNLL